MKTKEEKEFEKQFKKQLAEFHEGKDEFLNDMIREEADSWYLDLDNFVEGL